MKERLLELVRSAPTPLHARNARFNITTALRCLPANYTPYCSAHTQKGAISTT